MDILGIQIGDFFRTETGLIGKVVGIMGVNENIYIKEGNKGCLIEIKDIKKYSKSIIDLLEYKDLIKVFDKFHNNYFYVGCCSKTYNNSIDDLKNTLRKNKDMIIVGVVSKEKLENEIFYLKDTVCSDIEQGLCEKEKMTCKGCFYYVKGI